MNKTNKLGMDTVWANLTASQARRVAEVYDRATDAAWSIWYNAGENRPSPLKADGEYTPEMAAMVAAEYNKLTPRLAAKAGWRKNKIKAGTAKRPSRAQ